MQKFAHHSHLNVVVVVVVFIDFYYKVTETFIAIEDLIVLKEELLKETSPKRYERGVKPSAEEGGWLTT